jgi:hypothetical protein
MSLLEAILSPPPRRAIDRNFRVVAYMLAEPGAIHPWASSCYVL